MYRILVNGVTHDGDNGSGLLLFCDETRCVEYFTRPEFILLILFVKFLDDDMSGALRVHQSVYQTSLYDTLCIHHYGFVDIARVCDLRRKGFIVGIDTINHMPVEEFIAVLANPYYKFQYKYDVIIDTDGVLWYLNAGATSEVRLSTICKRVAKGAIGHVQEYRTVYIFDDDLEYAHPDCFNNDNFMTGLDMPRVRCSLKYWDRFKFVEQKGL